MKLAQPHSARFRQAIGLAAALLATATPSALAADSAGTMVAASRGVGQLSSALQPDGGFGTRLAVRDAATAGEAVRLVQSSSVVVSRTAAFLATQDPSDVDSLARAALGRQSAAAGRLLLGYQRPDGGFGLTAEYESDPLDTALALRALVMAGEQAAAKRAATQLAKFAAGGAWGPDGGDVAQTSEALLALGAYTLQYGSTVALDGVIAGGVGWLAGQQLAGGAWGAGAIAPRYTALAVSALAPFPTSVSRVSSGADALLAAQRGDGSWGDPFTTSLVVRALGAAGDAIDRARTAQLADPAVAASEVTVTPQTVEPGKTITVEAAVTNGGNASASGVVAEFYLADPATATAPVASAPVPSVLPGGRVGVVKAFSAPGVVGRQRVYVVVRSAVGADRDLTNNRASLNLFVRSPASTYPVVKDWPRPGRDIQHSGSSPNRLHAVVSADPAWRHRADGGQVVAEGKVFFGDGGQLTAVDAKSGDVAWQAGHAFADARYRTPLYNRGFVYTAGVGVAESLVARTGELAEFTGGWGGDVPALNNDVIPTETGYDPVFQSLAGATHMNQAANGGCVLWPNRDATGSPANDYAWKGVNPNYPSEYSPGRLFFDRPCDDEPVSFASDGRRAFMASGNSLSSFDPATGEGPNGEPGTQLFGVRLPGVARADTLPLIDSLNQVIVDAWESSDAAGTTPSGRGKVLAADPADGSVNWSFTTDARLDGSPVEYNGSIVVIDRSGRVYAVDQTTGALRWSFLPPGYTPPAADQQGLSGQTLALSGRYLYVPHPDGSLYTLDARNGTQLSATHFPARPYDLAIDDENNAIYVRTQDGWVGAYPTSQLPAQCAPDAVNAPRAVNPIVKVSSEQDGAPLAGDGAIFERPAISADGRVVAYARRTLPPSLAYQLMVTDVDTGVTTEVPEADSDGLRRQDARAPVLSADGRYLGFVALIRDSRVGAGFGVFVLDRVTGVTESALKNPDGSIQLVDVEGRNPTATDQANPPISMSGDGQVVAFSTRDALVASDTDGNVDAYVVNRTTGQRTLISRDSSGQQVGDFVGAPSLSRDGRWAAFTAPRSLTGEPIGTGPADARRPFVYLYDMQTAHLAPVSITASGRIVHGESPFVSADGRYVTFVSSAQSLIPLPLQDPDLYWAGQSSEVYVWDRTTGRAELQTIKNSGNRGRFTDGEKPQISDDGKYLVFSANRAYEKGVTSLTGSQIIGRDLAAGKNRQVSYNRSGISGDGASAAPVVSADGQRVAFVSAASDLVAGDTNGARDVFVLDRRKEQLADIVAPPIEPVAPNCPSTAPPVAGYSDLAVTGPGIAPSDLEQGQPAAVTVTVTNGGANASEATNVRVYDGAPAAGKLIGDVPLASISPGASTTVAVPWSTVALAGPHTLTAVVDPGQVVFEQNLANNQASRDVTVAAPRLAVTATTNKTAYGAAELVAITARLTNGATVDRDAALSVVLRDSAGDQVASLFSGSVRVGANAALSQTASWNTLDSTPGRYKLTATITGTGGEEIATSTTGVDITTDVHAALTLGVTQPQYAATDTATLRALVTNNSANGALTGANVSLALTTAAGAPVGSWTLATGDVQQGRSVLVTQDQALRTLAPGTYRAHAALLPATGSALATSDTSFVITSSATDAAGTKGTITATPTDPVRLTTATFAYSVTNSGNADLAGAKLRVRISDVLTGALVKTVDGPARTIARGTTASTGTITTPADMTENRDYQAGLHLVLAGGQEVALDRTIIRVKPIPVAPMTLTTALTTSTPKTGVLVWACDRADETAAKTALTGTFAAFVPDRSDPKYANTNGCGLFTSDEQKTFLRLLRSGSYNQIWLLGRSSFLELNLANEIAARVIQGDGLLIAGTSLGFDINLFGNKSPLGVTGGLPLLLGSYPLTFGAATPFAGITASVAGFPTPLNTGTASVLATTTYGVWPLRFTSNLAAQNTFGAGKAIMVGASPQMFTSPAAAAQVLDKAETVLQSANAAPRPGGIARLDVTLAGPAPGSPLEVRTTLPAGMIVIEKPSDVTQSGQTLTVPFAATGTTRPTKSIWVKLPPTGTSAAVTSTTYYKDPADGLMKPTGTPVTTTVAITATQPAAATVATTAIDQIVVIPNTSSERAKRDKIKADVVAASTDTTSTTVAATRITTLLADIGAIEKSTAWTNTTPAWKALAQLVTYAEYDYYRNGGQ